MTALSPCPFCGGINLHVALGILEQVYCEGCDAYGPARLPPHAQLAWNTRCDVLNAAIDAATVPTGAS